MTRGFVWGRYVSDDGFTYALQVDADYHAQTDRGWTTPATAGMPIYPRRWIPRKIVGLDEEGHPHKAVAATPNCPLWVGQVTTFIFNASDQLPHTAHVVATLTERRAQHPK